MAHRQPRALTRRALYRQVWSKPLAAVAGQVGLSGNALAKICSRLLVPYPSRGYWAKINAGKSTARPVLPPAPELDSSRILISAAPSLSRRTRTRLDPAARREQLTEVAKNLIVREGMNAASMKRIAADAGISETLAYNYFGSREKLFIELARLETAKLQRAQQEDIERFAEHSDRIVASTKSYLRQIDRRGALLQMLMMTPEVRVALRGDSRKRGATNLHRNAQRLVDLYGLPWGVGVGSTAVLSRLCGRAGQVIADKRASFACTEELCISIVVHGSRRILAKYGTPVRRAQRLKAA